MNYKQEIVIIGNTESVFKGITNGLNSWWGKTDNSVSKKGDEFTTRFGNAYWKFRIIEYIESKRITWECIDGEPEFNAEWIGTKIFWELVSQGDKTIVKFVHEGLTPEFKCYNICAPTWDMFITESLKLFIETGVGTPHLSN